MMYRIGTSPPRPDGFAKVSGAAKYADDFTLPGMLFGATVRSPHARARVDSINTSAVTEAGGFAVTAEDLPGPNGIQLIDDTWPILAQETTEHIGEAVALVAGETRMAARRLAKAVEVAYTPLEAVTDLAQAARHAPLCELSLGRQHPDELFELAFHDADHVVEGTWRTGHQEHIYIECQAMTAWFEDWGVEGGGTLNVAGSMQCPYYVHKSLKHAFALDDDQVRVRATVVGGGFGGKEDYPSMIAAHAALLARASGRPVRMVYDRHEDIVGTTKRHPAVVTHRTAVAADGTLRAMDIDVTMDGGAYQTLSPVVLSRALLHAGGAYRCPLVRVRGRVLKTNTATNGAFRGFGAPQTQFAAERQMDLIARTLDLDPLAIRQKNVLHPGDRLPTGQVLDETAAGVECLERVAEKTDFARRWQEQSEAPAVDGKKTGVGLSLFFHGAGFTGNGERRMRSPVTARLTAEGKIEVLTAMTDMGQGVAAIFPEMAAEAAGVTPDDLAFAEPDTSLVPDSGPTVASRTTMVVGGTLVATVEELRDQILGAWRTMQELEDECTIDGGVVTCGEATWPFVDVARKVFAEHGDLEVTRRHEPPADSTFDEDDYTGDAYPTYAWGAEVVEVEVDADTYDTRIRRADVVCEVGKAIHPTLCKGQIEGGTLQALGWGLMEEVKLDGGRYLNDRLATYIIPTFKDSPTIDVELLEKPWSGGPYGAKGIGELPMDGGASALAAAIENATGLAVDEIPATPERLLAAEEEEEAA